MKTFIVENTWLPRNSSNFDFGWGNGYVLIPIGHPLHGKNYDDINVNVHGGLIFSGLVNITMVEVYKLDKEDIGTWCVGFDTTYNNDTLREWTKERVQEETNKLRDKLIALGTSSKVSEKSRKSLKKLSKFEIPKTLLINNNNNNNTNYINKN